ncbi:MAG TPA: DUF1801 domain-containing protein [Vicinamibacterales bacterium]|nr:DUF1801 domain-containing protein [Vicinamibacterales bacterium]
MAKSLSPILSRAQLNAIIDARPPSMAKLTRAVLAKVRERLPGAVEMVYDKKNSLVIGFCSAERGSHVINSIATYTHWINLYFFEGDTLPDPEGLLQGTGSMVRSIRITDAAELDRPAVRALMAEARKCAEPPLDSKAKRKVLLKQATRRS